MDRASLEKMLEQGLSLAEIGRRFGRHEATVAYWVGKYGLKAVNRDKHRSKPPLTRSELEPLVEAGMSTREIAKSLERSQTTVCNWLREHDLQTRRSKNRRPGQSSGSRLMLECRRHGVTEFQSRSEGGYRCLRCRSESVARRRRAVKRVLVEEAGGACQICGYDRCIRALHFHHVDPSEKQFALSLRGATRSLAQARVEAKKCMLLCSNCHAEVEHGLIDVVGMHVARHAIVPQDRDPG